MKLRSFSAIVILPGIFLLIISGCVSGNSDSSRKKRPEALPNFIVFFTDDQGYGDLGCFGGNHVSTPNIDRLAREGIKLTDFYAAALCTPSRAALMTACYPKRINMATGTNFPVLLAGESKGLNPEELTMAEILKKQGYATGIFGKWHLGDQPEFLPTRQGFDEFFGIPCSHDIHPFHPRQDHFNFPPLPLYHNETLIETDPDADYFTQEITERALQFIQKNKMKPFFLYLPYPMPHHPIHVSPGRMGTVPDSVRLLVEQEGDTVNYTSRTGLYPAAISEIDWSVGEIVERLESLHLDSSTLIFFTSDNGPDAAYGCEALGSAGPLRGRKGSTYEGGMREPAVAYWPGRIPAGSESGELLTSMDLLPTFAGLAGAGIPEDRRIDGKDIWPVLSGQPDAKSPHDRFFYYAGNELRAVRSGPWKYHQILPGGQASRGDSALARSALYNLETDIGESRDLSGQYPEIVKNLENMIRDFEMELGKGDSLGTQCRPAGWKDDPRPLLK
jgi:arylsulfatase A-like enzyme